MSQALVREQWQLGWNPSADDNGGDPNGLLRMDNLKQDSTGALTLERGFRIWNTSGFAGFVHSIYAHSLGGTKYRFVGLGNGSVLYSAGNFSDGHAIIDSAGNPARARFSGALGSVFVASGSKKKKFDGEHVFNWGVETPLQPVTAAVNNQAYFFFGGAESHNYSNWELVEGTAFLNGTHVEVAPDTGTLRAVVKGTFSVDTMAFPGGGSGLDTDIFSFQTRIGETNSLDKIRVEILLDDQKNYYWFEWQHNIDQVSYVEGVNAYSILQAKRSEFQRIGDDTTLNWSTVTGMRVTFMFNANSEGNVVEDIKFSGSTEGPLNGDYDYIQINARDNGVYIAKSAVGPDLGSGTAKCINASVDITPASFSDPQINKIILFRRGGLLQVFHQIVSINLDTNEWEDAAGRKGSYTGTFTDKVTDAEAQDLAIFPNMSTKSMADIENEIFSIVDGIYFERLVCCTSDTILLSEPGNPDAIDLDHSIKLSGDNSERIFWLSKISSSVILGGTERNIYEIGGDLTQLPDNTINVNVRPLGEAHPPIALEFALDSGRVFYMANDGWRVTGGGASESLIDARIGKLFKSEARYGIQPVAIYPPASATYACATYKGQLYTSNILADGSRPLFIYDFGLKYWRYWNANPISLFTDEDGVLMGGFGGAEDNYLKVLDTGDFIEPHSPTGQEIFLQTVYDDHALPRNRKEAYTLRILMDTGNAPVNVLLAGDNGGFVNLGQYTTNGTTEVVIDLFNAITIPFGLGYKYALQIKSDNLQRFKFQKFIIEYDPRPETLTAIHVPNNNLGSFSRKRLTNYAFVVDTMGNDVYLYPLVDNTQIGDPVVFNTDSKRTYIHYFDSETIGTDVGCILLLKSTPSLNSPGFEFYGVNAEEIVSEKLPTPTTYLVIPSSNYGTPSRKRHSSYKFEINTRGSAVTFTPLLDGIAQSSRTYTTSKKGTVEYFFTADTIAIDVGGILESTDKTIPFEFYGVITPQDVEVLPPRLLEFRIPDTDYGTPNRKRHSSYKFQINTNGANVALTTFLDGSTVGNFTVNTPRRQTVECFFDSDTVGIDIGGELKSSGSTPFEFYGVIKPQEVEVLPARLRYFLIPPNDYGVPNRKRHTSYKFHLNTNGQPVTFTPIIDLVPKTAQVFNTPSKQECEYFFNEDTIGKDIGGTLKSNSATPFEFYGTVVPQQVETLPVRLTYFTIPPNDYGTPDRKRHSSYKFIINTNGADVLFTPIIDLAEKTAITINTPSKETVEYYFHEDTIGIDIGGTLSSVDGETPFEFYGVVVPEQIEKLPPRLKFFLIPPNDYGTPNRKRHSSYKFQINTNGKDVLFTPIIDGTTLEIAKFNTPSKKTVEYFFTKDTLGIDVGGKLESLEDTPFEFYGVVIPQEIETLPARLKYFLISPNDYGTPNRKRHSSFKFVLNTNGKNVLFTPIIDGNNRAGAVFNTPSKRTVEYFFNSDTIGIDIGGELKSLEDTAFEFYGTVIPQHVETLPDRLEYFLIPPNDYGVPNRKRHSSYKFQINTNGQDVQFTPIIDRASYPAAVFNTPSKDLVEYFFLTDTIGKDIGGELKSLSTTPFEFYGEVVPQQIETLPPRLKFFLIPPNDYGSPNRKRHSSFKFSINTNSTNVRFTPIIDGIPKSPKFFNTPSKRTVEYFFTEDTIGIDIGGTLESTSEAFEFYGVVVPQEIELLPPRLEFFLIPPNNYGQPGRKRHSSYKFSINTNGANVRFTPIIDLVEKTPKIFNTPSKELVEYFFLEDTTGIDIGGKLESLTDTPFEFYGILIPEKVEMLPPRLEEFRIPENNYGVAAPKRIRTMPMEINTNGSDVVFTPIVDNIRWPSTILNTPTRKTTFHFFDSDVFGTDYSGELVGSSPFEFYGLLKPEEVEVLPVAKVFDQIGPIHLSRIGKIIGFRIRIITNEDVLPWTMYGEDDVIATGTLVTVPGKDAVYEQQWLAKGRNATISRVEFGPSPGKKPFHRYYVDVRYNIGGKDVQIKAQRVK